jgi:hypothetical protein
VRIKSFSERGNEVSLLIRKPSGGAKDTKIDSYVGCLTSLQIRRGTFDHSADVNMFIETALLVSGVGAAYKLLRGPSEEEIVSMIENCRDMVELSRKCEYSFKSKEAPIERQLADLNRLIVPSCKHHMMLVVLQTEWRSIQVQAKRFSDSVYEHASNQVVWQI